jgi:hypothetical protein
MQATTLCEFSHGTQTLRVIVGAPNFGIETQRMSRGHSDAFEVGVQRRTQLPPLARAGTLAQVVSAQPG